MDTLRVVVGQRKTQGETVWSGTIEFPGLVGKVSRKGDTSGNPTGFASRNALLSSARGLARRLGTELEIVEPEVKKAAKKSVRKTTRQNVIPTE